MNTALEYSVRVVQEGGRRCKKSTLNDLVHLTPLRIPLMNPPLGCLSRLCTDTTFGGHAVTSCDDGKDNKNVVFFTRFYSMASEIEST
jgi:hypothetical protein